MVLLPLDKFELVIFRRVLNPIRRNKKTLGWLLLRAGYSRYSDIEGLRIHMGSKFAIAKDPKTHPVERESSVGIPVRSAYTKVDGSYVAYFLDRTFRYHWHMVQWGSKRKHRKDTCLKAIGSCLQILINTLHSTVNITNERTYVSSYEISKHALPTVTTKATKIR